MELHHNLIDDISLRASTPAHLKIRPEIPKFPTQLGYCVEHTTQTGQKKSYLVIRRPKSSHELQKPKHMSQKG